ncbi:hypothetical protein FGG08_003102 [Glutinoglossum americanum]|uniref:Fungal N-terminal domain-containing protein n=1 Tax=Glutinoglossum americanum TaxID=1670608 RepID=A0A9P8L100_9PEZI|nr:hypothetical protein FGG08_003102 [Glutinoglossum americanum]
MEPTITIVGFAASLATLATLVINSSKTLYNLRRRLKNAPEDITRLLHQLRDYEGLLCEVQHRLQQDNQGNTPGLQMLLARVAEQMKEDMEGFAGAIQRVNGLLDGHTNITSGKLLTLRIRHILQEDVVREYQRLISSHVGTLTLLLSILSNRKLDAISNRAAQLSAISSARFEFVCSALTNLHSSQNAQHKLHQSALTNIEGHLQKLQGQLSLSAVHPSRISSSGRSASGRAAASNCHATAVIGRTQHFSLPFWKVVTTHNSAVEKGSRSRHRHILTFVPPPWLSYIVLQWEFQMCEATGGGLPRMSLSLTPVSYNPSPEFRAAITNFDIAELRRLFREGAARPTDYVLLRKPMSLLEAFAMRVEKPNCRYGALAMYKFLLKEGCGNDDPILASLHSRVLISLAKRSQPQLRESLDAFLGHGGNMFWRHGSQGTIMSLIMRHGATFDCVHDYLFRQPEPWTASELSPIDRWLVGILAHTDERFRRALQHYLNSYRSLFYTSRTSRSSDAVFDIDSIVAEVQSAPTRDRIELLKILSKWGTGAMFLPFLRAGFDINETVSNELTPWLRLSYLGKAVRWGNPDTFRTLLDAGAAPVWALTYLSRHPTSLPPTKYPTSRREMILTLVERAEPEHLAQREEEMLSLLLRSDEIRGYCPTAADKLIDRFFLKRNDTFIQEAPELLNSYILIAIILDLPAILQSLLDHGFCINGNQKIGTLHGGNRVVIKGDVVGKFTWLTFATHFGRAACVKPLLDNGASTTRRDPCGRTALQIAEEYSAGPHPRAAVVLNIWPYQPRQRLVSAEDDAETSAALRLAAGMQRGVSSGGPRSRGKNRVLPQVFASICSIFQHLEGFVPLPNQKSIQFRQQMAALRNTVMKLSRLSITEVLLLGISYFASLVALLFYGIARLFPKPRSQPSPARWD